MEATFVFAHGQYLPETSPGRRLLAHELAHVIQQRGNRDCAGGHTLRPPGPATTQTPLQELDVDLDSSWTLDSTLLADLAALSDAEKAVVLSGTSYRDKFIARLDEDDLRTALTTLGADYMTWRDWLKAAGVTLFSVVPSKEFLWATPDGTLDAELEKRMMEMCRYLILNRTRVTDDDHPEPGCSLEEGVRTSRARPTTSSRGGVTLKDLQALLAPASKPERKRSPMSHNPGNPSRSHRRVSQARLAGASRAVDSPPIQTFRILRTGCPLILATDGWTSVTS